MTAHTCCVPIAPFPWLPGVGDGEELLANGGPTLGDEGIPGSGTAEGADEGAAARAAGFDGADDGCEPTFMDIVVWAIADDAHNERETGNT